MIDTLQSRARQGREVLRRYLGEPAVRGGLRLGAFFLGGLVLSAASLGNFPQSFAMGLVCACSGWSAVAAALGSFWGSWLFWGRAGRLCALWTAAALPIGLLLQRREICRSTPPLIPALAAFVVAGLGLFSQSRGRYTPIAIHLTQVVLAGAGAWLFREVLEKRSPLQRWLAGGVGILSLAQLMPLPWLNLGCLGAGALAAVGAFPAAALGGLALDLARITPVPMTAVMAAGYLTRFLPARGWGRLLLPGLVYLPVMGLCGVWDLTPLPALLLGCLLGKYLPISSAVPCRRGETGVLQVRLEMAAGVFAQSEQLLAGMQELPVDEQALVSRAGERACASCPCCKGCRDMRRIAQLPALILHKPLLSCQELPIVCRKSGRFLAELHRSQEQLRSIRADRERQREYRAAVIQQYRFLSGYLQQLSDNLNRRGRQEQPRFQPVVCQYGNRPRQENGDWCQEFPGIGTDYYVLLCDGMGTGQGAVEDGRKAGAMLRRLLAAGYPPEYALRSLNSLCALGNRAGAVTVDLTHIHLDTGRVTLYKWGAPASYLMYAPGVRKLGSPGAPPGLSVTGEQESRETLSMGRGEQLVLVSDGIDACDALSCCSEQEPMTPAELATQLIGCSRQSGQDDATVVILQLKSVS